MLQPIFHLQESGAAARPRNPLLVALCSSVPEEAGAETLRAGLRGIGADLVMLSPLRGVWISPDAEARQLRAEPAIWDAHGAKATARGGAPLTVLVYDEKGELRLRKVADAPIPIQATLLGAIREVDRRVHGMTRREVLAGSLVAGVVLALAQACAAVQPDVQAPAKDELPAASDLIAVTLSVNGKKHPLQIESRVTLLDALRENLHLTGTKKGCDMGQCGACTVHIDGMRANSCLQLAVMNEGREITTIEGLAKADGELHPMQQAFIDCDGLQCGYCTPGQILSAVALLREKKSPGEDEIREGMSGNLCRCGAYPNIVAAIVQVRGQA